MIEIKVWLIIVLLIEVPAIAMVAMHSPIMPLLRLIGFDWLMAVGMYMATAGLIVQVGRSNNYLKFDVYPVDEWFPLWILKDIGLSIMLYCILKLGHKLWKQSKEQ